MLAANHQVPTKLRRISIAVDDELYQALQKQAGLTKRSIANLCTVILEGSMFPGGRDFAPRDENRGGARPGAGRPRKVIGDAPGNEV